MKKELACGICDASFSGVIDRRSHLITRHAIDTKSLTEYLLFPFRCHECRRLITSFELLCRHLQEKHGISHHSLDHGCSERSSRDERQPGPTFIDALYNGYDTIELDELLRNTLQRSSLFKQ